MSVARSVAHSMSWVVKLIKGGGTTDISLNLRGSADDYIVGLQIPYNSLLHAPVDASLLPNGYGTRNFMIVTGLTSPDAQNAQGNANPASVKFDSRDSTTGIRGTVTQCNFTYNASETTYAAEITLPTNRQDFLGCDTITLIGKTSNALFFNGVADGIVVPQAGFERTGLSLPNGARSSGTTTGQTSGFSRTYKRDVSRVLNSFSIEAWVAPDHGGVVAVKSDLFELRVGGVGAPRPAEFSVHVQDADIGKQIFRATSG